MITPQLTEQYGHVLRVSVVRAIFSVLAWARTVVTSKPNAVRAAPPARELWRNARREIAIGPPQSVGGRSLRPKSRSETNQVELDFSVAVFLRPYVERGRGDLVDEGHGKAEAAAIAGLEVPPAAVARVQPDVLERRRAKIPEPALVILAAGGTAHAAAGPACQAGRTQQLAAPAFQRIGTRSFEDRQLWCAAAAGTTLGENRRAPGADRSSSKGREPFSRARTDSAGLGAPSRVRLDNRLCKELAIGS